jgi:hypothetical protein
MCFGIGPFLGAGRADAVVGQMVGRTKHGDVRSWIVGKRGIVSMQFFSLCLILMR